MKIHGQRKQRLNIKKFIVLTMMMISLVAGSVMIFNGVKGINNLNQMTVNYYETEASFVGYQIFRIEKQKTTYQLTYLYQVQGIEYTVSTEYGTDFIPKMGSTTTIKYNPNNPKQAVIINANSYQGFIFIGIIFMSVPMIIGLGLMMIMGYFKKCNIDIMGFLIGLTFVAVGLGAMYLITGGLSLIDYFRKYDSQYILPLLIMLLMIGSGSYLMIKSLFFSKNQK